MNLNVYVKSEEWKKKAREWLKPTQFQNGITLCNHCHILTFKKGERK